MRSLSIKGKGDYDSVKKSLLNAMRPMVKSAIQSAGGAMGSTLGGALAGPGGAMAGANAGRMLAARFSKLVGSGDYATNLSDVNHNSIVRYSGASEYASFADSKTSVRLRHREYLQDVFVGASGVFSNTSFAINPGLSNTFPFLAQIAGNFEEYHMHGLVFEFVSTTSPYNSTSAMGSVIMALEYNANAPPYTSKPQMENSDFAVSARPDKSMIYGVECANNAANNYYIRQGSSSLPLTTTDIGLFNIATLTPLATGVTLGELWVSYDVELFRPHISPSRYGYAHWALTMPNLLPAGVLNLTTVTVPVGVPATGVRQGSCSTFTLSSGADTVIMDSADVGDTFMFVITTTSDSAAAQAINIVTTGLTAVNALVKYTASGTGTGATTGITNVYYYTVTSNSVTPTVRFSTTQATTTAGDLDIIMVDVGNGLSVWPNATVATL